MKKLLSLWSMTVLLLFGAIAVTSCGGDDDDDFSDKKDDKEKTVDDDPTKAIPAGYYAFEYEADGKKLYGNLDLELYINTRDAAAAGDTGYFTEELFKKYEGYPDALGAYVYVKNGKRYISILWEDITKNETERTYTSRTYSYPGGSVTVYYNIFDVDNLEPINSNSGYSYSNGYLDCTHNNSTTRYKLLSYNKKFDWIEEYCSKEVDKLNGDY
ncbi:hypothetical protein L6475_00100 [Prevotella sp. E9-3]|uniref:hypothetical protein n=1 Tax=Prevotella sp. E9-3 TaxID=2913621 RepID=UPI001EDBD60A|nr:hypothetical protein [Prevotella sp. E9-3]UKK48404.1 hypothetical protein L6475_00100 [Prevotella sp. E9-3]